MTMTSVINNIEKQLTFFWFFPSFPHPPPHRAIFFLYINKRFRHENLFFFLRPTYFLSFIYFFFNLTKVTKSNYLISLMSSSSSSLSSSTSSTSSPSYKENFCYCFKKEKLLWKLSIWKLLNCFFFPSDVTFDVTTIATVHLDYDEVFSFFFFF